MDKIFIEARIKVNEEEKEKIKNAVIGFAKLPFKKISLISSVQYLDFVPLFKKELEKNGKIVLTSKGNLARYEAQIIGCDVNAARMDADAFILLSTGRFHAFQLALKTEKPIFVWNSQYMKRIHEEEIWDLKKKRSGAIKKFLAAGSIGIIVSTKPGQTKLKEALEIRKRLEKKGKRAFIFIADTINLQELENFSCQSWINTACPALILDSQNLVDYDEVSEYI